MTFRSWALVLEQLQHEIQASFTILHRLRSIDYSAYIIRWKSNITCLFSICTSARLRTILGAIIATFMEGVCRLRTRRISSPLSGYPVGNHISTTSMAYNKAKDRDQAQETTLLSVSVILTEKETSVCDSITPQECNARQLTQNRRGKSHLKLL